MYDINLKNVKKGYGFYSTFLIAGILFFIILGGILGWSIYYKSTLDASILSESVNVRTYTDDEGTTMYYTTYHYKVNGKEYTCKSKSSSSIYPKAINKEVYYNSKKPENCMTQSDVGSNKLIMIIMIIPIISFLVGFININKIRKRVKLIKELNNRGKLVKNLPYRMESTGMSVNGIEIMKPVVDYVLPSGEMITLYGDPRHDKQYTDADGMVDLIIDENNPENYFIDFEINRLTGNSDKDYYKDINS